MRLVKTLSISTCGALLLTGSALADATWVGDTSTDWNDPANWDSDPNAPAGNFFVNIDGANSPVIAAGSAHVPVDVIIGNAGNAGRLDHNGGSLSLFDTGSNGNWFFVGRDTGSTGTLNVHGDASLNVGKLYAGGAYFFPGGTGTIDIDTTGTVNANSTSSVDYIFGGSGFASIAIGVGDFGAALGTGTINVRNGTVNATGQIHVGSHGGTGTLNQTGGTINTTGLSIGRWRGSGEVNVSNGTLNAGFVNLTHAGSPNDLQTGTMNVGAGGVVNSEGDFVVAFAGAAGSQGTLNINAGGVVNVATQTERWLIVSQWDPGINGTINVDGGTLNLNANTDMRFAIGNNGGNTVVNLNAGAINAWAGNGSASGLATGSVVDLNRNSANANSTFNLNGGVLTINQVITTNDNGNVAFNFNGGTLRAAGASANFVNLGGANQSANILAGGAFVDTNGFDNTIVQALVGTGDLHKLGAGTLTLAGANTYSGSTVVEAGTLTLAETGSMLFVVSDNESANSVSGSGSAHFAGSIRLDLSGVLSLAGVWNLIDVPGLGATFAETFNVVDAAGLLTFSQNDDVWTSNDGTWQFAERTGNLTRIVPEPATLGLLAAVAALGVMRSRRR